MNVRGAILPTEEVPDQLAALLEAIHQREFGWDHLTYSAPRWYVMGMLAGRVIGCVRMLERTISVGEAALRVGGITGVVTEPEHRNRGVARKLVGDAIAFLKNDRDVPFVLLTCNRRLGPLYEKLGWRIVMGPTTYSQPDGSRTCPGLTMIFACCSDPWPDGPIDLQGLPW